MRDAHPAKPASAADAATVPVAAPPALAAAEPRLAGALAPGARAAIAAHFADAARAGLPVEPLVAKALEGVELGAAPDRIDAAVRALLARLATARVALAPVVGDAELVAGADALAAGVPAEALRRVRALSPGRSAAVALGVLAQLVARGVPPARAADAVTTLLRRGARAAQLVALDDAVRLDVAAGVPAAAALDSRARTLAGGLLLSPTRTPGTTGGLTTTGTDQPTSHPAAPPKP
ncbi:hypothetical protein tb265_24530 [Gemmatimonadetes bacterium T265]|nr:hypothetical protein tb265_24530 [Gemmatimonadetes bacterium T265]